MKQMFNHWSLVPAVAALIILTQTIGAFAQPVNVEAAKKEGKIVVYGSVVPQAMEGLHQAFKKKYGIDVEYWRGSSTQVSERALTEWRAGKPGFDIAEGNRGVQLIMKNEGLFQKFIPPASEKFPAQYKEKDGLITPWRVLPISILYNTELVKTGRFAQDLRRSVKSEMERKNLHSGSDAPHDYRSVSLESGKIQR